jgi:hypothetical protein
VLAQEEERWDDVVELYADALHLRPVTLPLAIECGRELTDAGHPQAWLDILSGLPDPVRTSGRVRLLEGQAALAVGDLERVERLLADRLVIDDLREGERSLSHLWFAFHERRLSAEQGVPVDDALRERVRREFPVPDEIDFRMS